MEKVWIIRNGKSYRLCRSEQDMLKRASMSSDIQEILEYQLTSQSKSSDYFKSKERDNQLKSILGELDKSEQSISDLISLYEKLAPDGRQLKRWDHLSRTHIISTEKENWLGRMRKFQNNKKAFVSLLINYKRHFFTLSNEVEWLKSILSCHNFMGCDSGYNSTTSEELRTNFLLAKEELRQERRKSSTKKSKK